MTNSVLPSDNELDEALRGYTQGDNDAAERLIALVDEHTASIMTPDRRAILMAALLSRGRKNLDERSSQILKTALMATTDERYLTNTGLAYLEDGDQWAAETLIEWRAILAARKRRGSDMHIDALVDLAEVYEAGGKSSDATNVRNTASALCEARAADDKSVAAAMLRLAKACFDASDLPAAEKLAHGAMTIAKGRQNEQLDGLRVLHAVARKKKDYDAARGLAKRIQQTMGGESVDEIDRLLLTYLNLPERFDLALRPDGIDLTTDHFPKIILETSGLDLEKYFIDAFSQAADLTPEERSKLAAGLYQVMRTITTFSTAMQGATVTRSEVTDIDLPAAMSGGYVQKVTFDKTVTFRLMPNPPDEATFVNVSGITFSVGGKLVAMSELSLRADGDICVVTPTLAESGNIKRTHANAFEALKNTGKDFLVSLFLKTQTFSTKLPIDGQQFREHLLDAINFKKALHFKEKDLLTFFERCSRIEIDDPLTRSLLERGTKLSGDLEKIRIERTRPSDCNLEGINLKIDSAVDFTLKRDKTQLAIPKIAGIKCAVAFDAPSDLKVIGLDLRKSLPQRIESLTLGARNTEKIRRILVGTAPERWIGLDLNAEMRPATDANGNWMVFGVVSNPISGAAQSFYLRLDCKNEINMSTRELAALVNQTAMEGFDPADPMTWHWGAVAVGSQTLLAAGAVLRSTIGDEATDEIAEEVQKGIKFIKKLLF